MWEKEEENVRAAGVFLGEEIVDFLMEMCKNEEDKLWCFLGVIFSVFGKGGG